ncbi:MAG: alpha/beta fold hydrolase, partial [Acidobacteria bacterium]
MPNRTIDAGSMPVYLLDEGAGPPVLFLHGNPDSAELWRGVIDRLAGRCRCLAPDLPGFGRTPAPADFDCSLPRLAAFVEELVQALDVEAPLDLVVHDFGGPYGLAWAVEHPDRVRRLVAINTLFFADYRWHFWGRVWRTPVLGELSMLLMNRWLFARELRRGSPGLPRDHVRRAYALTSPAMKRMVLRLYRATDPRRFAGWEERLLELAAHRPTLVLWGERDPY